MCLQPAVYYDFFVIIVSSFKKKSDSNIIQLLSSKLGNLAFCNFTPVINIHQDLNDVGLLYLKSYSRLKHTKEIKEDKKILSWPMMEIRCNRSPLDELDQIGNLWNNQADISKKPPY